MAEAVDEFRSALRRACRARPRILLLSNATGAPVGPDDDVAERLARQLTRPVEWHATLATLASQGVTAVVGVGPGKALCRLAERELGAAVSVRCVDSPEGLAAAAALAAA
jgi:[acyl-carrier-protein] S-malonyltransferase